MGLGNMILLTQVTSYMLIFLFSFFIFIPMVVNLSEFNGHCLLFSDGKWERDNKSDPYLTEMKWGDTGYCNFVTFVGIIAMPLSLFYVIWLSVYLFKDVDLSWFGAFGTTVVCGVMAMFVLVAGIVTACGFHQWCDLLSAHVVCENADYIPIFKDSEVSLGGSYIEYGMIQFGIWASWICWLVTLGLASYNLYQYHRQENFFIRMTKERQRLLGDSFGSRGSYGQPSDPSA